MTIPWLIHNTFNLSEGRPTHEATMLGLALVIAQRSTCRRRRVGAVLTDDNGRVLSMGHNGVAKGQPHCLATPCPGATQAPGQGLELCEALHAEQNALMFCGNIMKVHTAFVTASPCVHCLKMLLNTSCERIVFLEEYPHAAAKDMWTKAGRKWEHFHG